MVIAVGILGVGTRELFLVEGRYELVIAVYYKHEFQFAFSS